jgi:23S rRNA pseudouridine1911/1915/1917 synthase
VDKPPFVLSQPGEGGDEATLDELVLDLLGAEPASGDAAPLTFRPGLAHRLDRGTSGIVLFGLTAAGLRGLTERFRQRQVEKRYLALVAGEPPQDRFTVDLPLARDPSDDTRGAKVKVSRGEGAQEALTEFTVLARAPDAGLALVEARPRTGRTHQIRAHLRAVRLPIAGDPTYGDPRTRAVWVQRGLRRQFLHAWRVRLAHPVDAGRVLAVESPLPPDLRKALARAGLADVADRLPPAGDATRAPAV